MKLKGQITVYLALTFAIVISVFLTVYDSARMSCAKVCAECLFDSGLSSAFGEYNKELLEKYDLYFVDLSYLSNSPSPDNIAVHIENFMKEESDLTADNHLIFISDITGINSESVELNEYRLATDNSGNSFKRQAIDYMKSLVLADAPERILGYSSILESNGIDVDKETQKLNLLINEDSSKKEDWKQTVIKKELGVSPSGVLMKISSESEMSSHVINLADTTLIRQKNKGICNEKEEFFTPAEELLFNEYLLLKFSHRTDVIPDRYMHMETEYIISGLPTDYSNEYALLCKLLAIRTAANAVTIKTDSDLKKKAETLGKILSALTEIPEPVATEGVIIIWGLAEGLIDIKDIARDVRVPLIKKGNEIQLDISNWVERQDKGTDLKDTVGFLTTFWDETAREERKENWFKKGDEQYRKYGHGLDYEEYLRILLNLANPFVKQYRAMDLIELNLRHSETGNEFFKMDVCTDMIDVTATIESIYGYRFTVRRKYSYF